MKQQQTEQKVQHMKFLFVQNIQQTRDRAEQSKHGEHED